MKSVKGKTDTIDIIEKKRQQWYGHVKRMSEERIPKLIMEWVPLERVGTAVAQWLRSCATNRKAAGSIPAGVTGIFH